MPRNPDSTDIHLCPCVSACQIPFDASVRVSLDTNLCMIYERDEGVEAQTRWYRDPTRKVPDHEITRFPHAVLEVKLEIAEGNDTPDWVTEVLESGMVSEVHKFSKFIHGCAVLMQVTAFPVTLPLYPACPLVFMVTVSRIRTMCAPYLIGSTTSP